MGAITGGARNIVTNGLVLNLDAANYKSYPGNGTVWTDLTGNRNNAVLTNGPIFSSTNGGSFYFDKTNDYARITNTNINGGSFAYPIITCNLWYNPADGNSTTGIANNIITVESSFEISTGNNGNGTSKLYYASNPWAWYGTDSGVLTNNKWNMITFVHASTGRWLYVNGNEIFYRGDSGNISAGISGYPYMTLMARYSGDTNLNNGNLAVVQLYNRVLSASEILQNFNSTRARFGI